MAEEIRAKQRYRNDRIKPIGKELDSFLDAYASGVSREELQAKYGVTWSTIKHWASEHSIPRAPVSVEHSRITQASLPKASYGELLGLFSKASELYRKRKPPINESIAIRSKWPVIIVSSADWHIGDLGVDYEQLDADVEIWNRTPGLYVLGGGDGVNNPIKPNRGEHDDIGIESAWGLYIAVLTKLKDHLLGIGSGNHDGWTKDSAGIDEVSRIAETLRIRYLNSSGFIDLKVGRQTYEIFRTHKTSFNSRFNPTHGLKQMRRINGWTWDVGIAEHSHVSALEEYELNGQKIIIMKPGSYKTYDEFARSNGFFGVTISNPAVVFWPDQRKLVGFRDYHEAIEYRDGCVGG